MIMEILYHFFVSVSSARANVSRRAAGEKKWVTYVDRVCADAVYYLSNGHLLLGQEPKKINETPHSEKNK